MTCRFDSVRTPPGEMLLHVAPHRATRNATFFAYGRIPPLLAAYSGNSAPVCALADATRQIDRIAGCTPYRSVVRTSALRFTSMSSAPRPCTPAQQTSTFTSPTSGSGSAESKSCNTCR